MVFVVLRAANSGCDATSVVPPISFSWRATQRAVPGDHQVGFDVVRTLLNRDEVAGQRVFGHVPAGAAMRYDKWPFGSAASELTVMRTAPANPARDATPE